MSPTRRPGASWAGLRRCRPTARASRWWRRRAAEGSLSGDASTLFALLECLDDAALRRWCEAGLAALRRHQREIDELNVYPVPDGDTGLVQGMAAVGLPAVGRRRRRRARRHCGRAAGVDRRQRQQVGRGRLPGLAARGVRVAKQQGVCCDAGARNPQDAEHGPKGSVNDTVHLAYTKLRAMIALRTQDKVRAAAEVLHPGRQVPARPRGVAGRGGGASGHGCSVLPSWGAPG
ncbi:hypothetical protein DKL51_02395 [Micromonospora globispora]|nr:hypothetical protein DKL51_02395 [Micromonospora globispora]